MTDISIELEAVNFRDSVIQIIAESIQQKFLFDYQTQKEVFKYIKFNINSKSYILPKTISNSEIIDEFIDLRANFREYIKWKLSNKVESVNLEKTTAELLNQIYFLSIKFIDETISEITDKIDRIKNCKSENEEEEIALKWFNSSEVEKNKIVENYQKKLEQKLSDTIKSQKEIIDSQKSETNPGVISYQIEHILDFDQDFNSKSISNSIKLKSLNFNETGSGNLDISVLHLTDALEQNTTITNLYLNSHNTNQPNNNIIFSERASTLELSLDKIDFTLGKIHFNHLYNLINFSETSIEIVGELENNPDLE
ncbi:hypothetical protein A1I_01350 [Rickettsia bellii OSU 85-389]|uniref:hypothetical protein n=1 Tax=Rickettsia bellii TaxID=33990 RepID=UPI0000DB0DF7|nr:hypothetical protein [Rickettsia bellii]ABV78662.1 hypothetical protein A1I_01350 [Rickettsia bellii OSU 85-389]